MRDHEEEGGGERPLRPWVDRPARPQGGRGAPGWRRFDQPNVPVRQGSPAPPLEEGEELVAGRRPVEEAFAAGRAARRLLVTPQRRQALEKIVLHATTLRIPIVEVEGGSLTALAGFDGHQGVAVVVDARRFASVEDVLARAIERSEAPFIVVLDSLEDPQNVGTLLRSAEAVGVHGVVFPTERQAPLSPAAVKASAGATEHLLLAPVDDLAGTLTDLHLRGVRIVGSEADAPLLAREADLRGSIALVVGSEGHGLSPAVRRRCDLFVRLPMRGAIDSLNAAVAGSVFLFEILGQREAGSPTTLPRNAPQAPAKKSTRQTATEPNVRAVAGDAEADPETADSTEPEPEPTPIAAPEARSGVTKKAGAAAKSETTATKPRAAAKASAASKSETTATKPSAAPKASPASRSGTTATKARAAAAGPSAPTRKSGPVAARPTRAAGTAKDAGSAGANDSASAKAPRKRKAAVQLPEPAADDGPDLLPE